MPDGTILITGIAGDVAQAVARIVREVRPHWRLVGADVHLEHAGSLLVDDVETLPPADSSDYAQCLEELARRHCVHAVIPMSEAELRVLHRSAQTSVAAAPLLGVSHRALEVGLDKLRTARFLQDIGIPSPWTVEAVVGVEQPELPCIYKPRMSAGSKGVAVCRTAGEAAWYAGLGEAGMFQQLLLPPEREVTCAVYRDHSGRSAVLPLLRRLAGGLTAWARVIDAPDAEEQCVRIADALDLHGPINVQMRLTSEGPRIFEINPRFSSTVFLRHLIGFRDVAWMLDELEGKLPSWVPPGVGTEVVRTQGGALLHRSRE